MRKKTHSSEVNDWCVLATDKIFGLDHLVYPMHMTQFKNCCLSPKIWAAVAQMQNQWSCNQRVVSLGLKLAKDLLDSLMATEEYKIAL